MQTKFTLTPFLRRLIIAAANLIALLVYVVGLISPLTPSDGFPSLIEIFVFVGTPVAILGWCIYTCGSRVTAIFLGLQLVSILAFSATLLYWQLGP